MNVAGVISIIIFVIIFGGCCIYIYCYYKKQKEQFKSLIDNLKAEKVRTNLWSFMCGTDKVFLYYYPGGRNRSSMLSISMPGDFNAQCAILKGGASNGFFTKLGIDKEIPMMDPEISGQYRFICEDDAFVQSLTQNADFKSMAKEIFQNFNNIQIKGNACSFVKIPFSFNSLTSEQVNLGAQKLVEFIHCIPKSDPAQGSLTPQTEIFAVILKRWTSFTVPLFSIGIFIYIFVGNKYYPVSSPWHVFLSTLWVSLPVLWGFSYLAFIQLKGHSRAVSNLLSLVSMGGIGLVISIWIAMRLLNGYLDKSSTADHVVYVTSKHISTSSKYGDSYYVTVNPWKAGNPPYEFRVNKKDYDVIPVSDLCMVWTKKGALGYEWVSDRLCRKGDS